MDLMSYHLPYLHVLPLCDRPSLTSSTAKMLPVYFYMIIIKIGLKLPRIVLLYFQVINTIEVVGVM